MGIPIRISTPTIERKNIKIKHYYSFQAIWLFRRMIVFSLPSCSIVESIECPTPCPVKRTLLPFNTIPNYLRKIVLRRHELDYVTNLQLFQILKPVQEATLIDQDAFWLLLFRYNQNLLRKTHVLDC